MCGRSPRYTSRGVERGRRAARRDSGAGRGRRGRGRKRTKSGVNTDRNVVVALRTKRKLHLRHGSVGRTHKTETSALPRDRTPSAKETKNTKTVAERWRRGQTGDTRAAMEKDTMEKTQRQYKTRRTRGDGRGRGMGRGSHAGDCPRALWRFHAPLPLREPPWMTRGLASGEARRRRKGKRRAAIKRRLNS